MKTMISTRSLVALLIAVLCGQLYGRQPDEPAGQPPDAPAKFGARAEDLLWSSAQECLKKVQYKEAREKFIRFSRQYHNDQQYKEALFYQGLCELKLGQEAQALNVWEQVVKLERLEKTRSAVLLQTLEQLAGYYDGKGQETEKKKMLSQLLADFPEDPVTVRLHVQAAEARLKASDYAGAQGLYRAVESKLAEKDRKNFNLAETMTKKGGQQPRDLLEAANESLEQNNVDAAIALYEAFLSRYPNSPMQWEARNRLGWCLYLKAGEKKNDKELFRKAEKLWDETVKKGPTGEWLARSRWNLVVLHAGPYADTNKARALCEEQFKEFKSSWRGRQAKLILAWLYMVDKQWKNAQTHFQELVEVYNEQNNPRIAEYLAKCDQALQKTGGR